MLPQCQRHPKRNSSLFFLAIFVAFFSFSPRSAGSADGIEIVSGKTPQGYAYMSGGVGSEERNQMEGQANRYDLKLSFADHAGEYLSDVRVAINDEHGKKIVNTTTAGPWFYINLPAGKYEIKATFDNRQEEIKDLRISEGPLATRLLHWDVADHQLSQR
jgi:hypothetical protein